MSVNNLPNAGTGEAIWLNELLNNIHSRIQRFIRETGEKPLYIVLPAGNLQRVKIAMRNNSGAIEIGTGVFGPLFYIFSIEVLESHNPELTDYEVVGRKGKRQS